MKVMIIVKYRAKKRMFLAIKKFARNHKIAKRFLKTTLKETDLRRKKRFFNTWKTDL